MKQIKMNAICYAQMCAAMIEGDMTCEELAQETGLHIVTVYQYARELHRFGAAHIARYLPDVRGRHLIKVYKLGPGRDAKRVRMSHAERQQRTREKRKAMMNPLLRMAA
jgi:hypothetical protein